MTKQEFFSQERLPVDNMRENANVNCYQLADTKQVICELTIESKKGGEPVDVAIMADTHIHVVSEKDDNDEEVQLSSKCRGMIFRHPSCFKALENATKSAEYCDFTVVAGDVIDYLTYGALDYAKELLFDRLPNLICTLAIHDVSKNNMTNLPDKLAYEERINILKPYWPNDVRYASAIVGDRAVLVGLDNDTTEHYFEDQVEKLQAEIIKARKDNNIIFIFQHTAIATGKEEDKEAPNFFVNRFETSNVYDRRLIGNPNCTNETDKKMIDLITSNSDVIKGIFCGHFHDGNHTQLPAYYIDEQGVKHDQPIDQYMVSSTPYCLPWGVITRLIIK